MTNLPANVESTRNAVYAALDAMQIPYKTVSHAPTASIQSCAAAGDALGAVVCKNYFLVTKSGKNICLCLVRPNVRLRTADISKQVASPRLSFAGDELLWDCLRTHPGAVSPMGLLFDSQKRVRLLADRALKDVPRLAFHPCDNTRTLAMSSEDFFERFVPALGRETEWVDVHDFLD